MLQVLKTTLQAKFFLVKVVLYETWEGLLKALFISKVDLRLFSFPVRVHFMIQTNLVILVLLCHLLSFSTLQCSATQVC